MFVNTGKAALTRLQVGGVQYVKKYAATQPFHTSAKVLNYMAAAPLPLPNNVDAAETRRFSPQRARDISATVVSAQAPVSAIDVTTDNSFIAADQAISAQDPHVQSYDCFGVVNLNSVRREEGYLGLPTDATLVYLRATAITTPQYHNLHSSHYRELRDNARASWMTYDQNAILPQPKGFVRSFSTQARPSSSQSTSTSATSATPTPAEKPTNTDSRPPLSKKEQFKSAIKEYGSTIVVFHVGISLISLGGFYLLVSSGINLMPVLEFLGISSSAVAEKVATGSTFVVAYAVHKVFAPVRLSITLGSAPFIVRYLRSKGFLKPK